MTASVRRVFPHAVREVENVWIPLPGGLRLAARLWLPSDAGEPVPAVVEYIPYRKRDGTRARDEAMHHWFAGHGYAAVRVDVRGSGDSDGVLSDEYTEEEHTDGLAALRWIAAQEWCDGSVGMIGKSWGGFNALQIAALAPPELRAVISVCSTDDRYADDAHYMGGCLLTENLTWGAMLTTLAAQAPDPEIVGERWRSMWMERLEALEPHAGRWLAHPRRDAYWEHGSVCEDYAAIRCPVYAVGGWADGYTNSVPRLLAGLPGPRKGLVGPWAHVYPHDGVPGPAIGFLQEARRFWERWLRERPNGIDAEPAYRVWMQEGIVPGAPFADRPGRWVAEPGWPTDGVRARRYALNAGARETNSLDETPGPERALAVCSPQTVGLAAGAWCAFGLDGDLPGDQRADDAGALVFDSEPLAERLEILGAPVIELDLAADRPQALLAVRLVDVAPDGAAERVSYGLLNLSHRAGHAAPEPLVPGERVRLRVELAHAAHAFAPGRRLRVALSSAYWPIAWPAPEAPTLTVWAGASALELPARAPRTEDAALRPFEDAERAERTPDVDIDPGGVRRHTEHDPASGETVHTVELDTTGDGSPALTHIEPIDLVLGHAIVERFRIRADDPLSARVEIEHRTLSRRAAWETEVRLSVSAWSTREAFHLDTRVEARGAGGELVHERSWAQRFPRDHV